MSAPAHVHQHAASSVAREPFTLGGLEELLRRKGLRMTANRRAILRALLEAESPLSLEQIQTAGGKHVPDGDTPDFATVFRMMTLLEELKLARKVNLGRALSFYELTDSDHHRDHLVCTDCGQVTPLEGMCPVERLERQIARKHGFTQLTHSLEFFGLCGDCSGSAAAP
jgi:Fur family ferric uptake transcriptional regulator